MTDPLARMTVLIAGAGSGMGRATAVAAASAGARTLLLGRTRPGLEVTEAAAKGAGAAPAILVADAADPAALAAALADPEIELVLHAARQDVALLKRTWHTDVRNLRSQAAIERLGASREGVLRHHRRRPDGSLRDTVQYAMVAAEWPAVRDRLAVRSTAGDAG